MTFIMNSKKTQDANTLIIQGLGVVVFSATFNNIAVISWWSVLLVKETEVPKENH
jgi:hypothetical protein